MFKYYTGMVGYIICLCSLCTISKTSLPSTDYFQGKNKIKYNKTVNYKRRCIKKKAIKSNKFKCCFLNQYYVFGWDLRAYSALLDI